MEGLTTINGFIKIWKNIFLKNYKTYYLGNETHYCLKSLYQEGWAPRKKHHLLAQASKFLFIYRSITLVRLIINPSMPQCLRVDVFRLFLFKSRFFPKRIFEGQMLFYQTFLRDLQKTNQPNLIDPNLFLFCFWKLYFRRTFD